MVVINSVSHAPIARLHGWGKHHWHCLLLLLSCLARTSCAWSEATPPLSISKRLPADAAFVYTTDTTGVAECMAKLLALHLVKSALDDAEKELGVSLSSDVLPWVGRLGYTLMQTKAGSPAALLLLEIRDQTAFDKALPLLQTKLEALADLKWTTTTYTGVDLRYAPIPGGTSLAWGQFGGWLVIGVGDGAIRQGIDVWKGNVPALSENAGWAKMSADVPTPRGCMFCLQGDALAKLLDAALGAKTVNTAALQGLDVFGSMTELADSARIELCSTHAATAQRQQLVAFKGTLTPPDEKALTQFPRGAIATLLSSNPGAWLDAVQHTLLGFAVDADDQQSMKDIFTPLQPLFPLLHAVSGAFGVSAHWTKENGFGLAAAGNTGNTMQAKLQVLLLSEFVKTLMPDLPMPLEVKDDVVSVTKEMELNNDTLHLKACWMAKDGWLIVASAPEWITAPAIADIMLPTPAQGADCALMADLGFVTTLKEQLEAHMLLENIFGHDGGGEYRELSQMVFMMTEALHLLGLDGIKLQGYARIADDGANCHAVLELQHANSMMPLFRIIPIAASLFIPISFAIPEVAQQRRSCSNIRQLALASMMYCQDHDEILPPLKTPEDIKRVLELDDKICRQPSSKLPYLPNPNVAAKALGNFNNAENVILFYEQTPYTDGGRWVAFLDGHVSYVAAKDWLAMKAKAGIK